MGNLEFVTNTALMRTKKVCKTTKFFDWSILITNYISTNYQMSVATLQVTANVTYSNAQFLFLGQRVRAFGRHGKAVLREKIIKAADDVRKTWKKVNPTLGRVQVSCTTHSTFKARPPSPKQYVHRSLAIFYSPTLLSCTTMGQVTTSSAWSFTRKVKTSSPDLQNDCV